jgi:hypothetical protein
MQSRRNSFFDGKVVMATAWNGLIQDAVKNSGGNVKIAWEAPGDGFQPLGRAEGV